MASRKVRTVSIMTHHTGTPAAGRHAAPVTFDNAPTVPADTLAFTIGGHDDDNQLRAFWVREAGTSHLEIEGGQSPNGSALVIRTDQIPMLAAVLREVPNLAATR
jgi:hypothetical protein